MSRPAPGPARPAPGHRLTAGADAGTATLRPLPGRSQLADLIWEAPASLAARHAHLFQAILCAW